MAEMFDLRKFDEYKEDNRREVKKAKGGLPVSLWDTYSAFANCYGGVIILGVSENPDGSWKTTGLEDERKVKKDFWDTINNKTKVSQNLLREEDVETFTDEKTGNVIMVVQVPKAERSQRPIYLNGDLFGATFRRNWEGDYHCTPGEVRAMLRDETEESMDMKILEDFTVEQLNMESVHGYRNRHRTLKPGHPWNEKSDEEYLEMIGAARKGKDGRLHPTAAGLLMFGDEYRIVQEFPEYFLDYREMLDPSIRWTDRLYSSTGEWSGNLYDFYFRVYNKLIVDVKVPFKMEGGTRIDDTPVHKALREALANCLTNTDFFVPRGVVIKKEPGAIIMENPGYSRVGKYQMRKGGESDPRNKTLMKMFNLIDIGERAGSGVPELFAVWKNEGWEEPVIEERFGDAARTVLTLSFKKTRFQSSKVSKSKAETLDETLENKIMECIFEHEEITQKEISEKLGVSIQSVKRYMKKMTENSLIERVGGKRYGHWEIIKNGSGK